MPLVFALVCLEATPALAQSITLSHSLVTVKTATLTISGHVTAWWHQSDKSNATCASVAANTSTANLTNLTGGATYVWKAYSDSSCATELASTTFTTIGVTVDQVTSTTARLNIANNTHLTWSYKQTSPSGPACRQDDFWAFDPSKTSDSLTGLSPNSTYTFTVYFGDDCLQANKADDVSFTTTAATLAVSNVTKTTATLGISGHSNIAWWYQGNQSGATCEAVAANTLTANLANLTVGTEYTYKVYNASGCAVANEIGSLTFSTEAGAPGAPSNLSSGKTYSAATSMPVQRPASIAVRMSWTSGANNGAAITNTQVRYRRTSPVGSWLTDTAPPRTEWTPTFQTNNPLFGKAMEFQVRDANSKGNGAWSASSAFTIAVTPAKPAAPSITPGHRQLGLSWTAPDGRGADISGYDVQYRPGNSGDWTDHTHSGAGTTATVTGLNQAAAYQARVRATNSQGNGDWSDEATGTPVAPPPDLWVENINTQTAEIVLRHWTGGAWSWKVAGRRSSGCFNSRSPSHSTFQLLRALSLNTHYTVMAHRGHGCAAANLLDTETFTTRARGWQAPALSVANVGSTGATLNIANHSGDWWYWETADKASGACKKVDAGTSSASLAGLTPNKYYEYKAFSGSGCGNSAAPLDWITQPVDFTTSGPIAATVTDLTDTSATLAVSGIRSGQWSTHHIVTGEPNLPYSQCLTYDYTTTSAVVTGLTAGTAYTFYVYRGGKCAFVDDRLATQAHTFQFSSGSVGSTSATLTLEHYEGAWSYQGGGASGSGGQAAGASAASSSAGQCQAVPSGTYTANLDGLTANTSYTYTAHGGGNCAGAALGQARFTTQAASPPPAPPAAPTGLTASAGDASVTLSWSDPSDDSITGYEYNVNHNATGTGNFSGWSPWQAIDGSGAATTSHTLTDLTNGREYRFHVRAVNADGAGAQAPDASPWFVSATPQEVAEPPPPPEPEPPAAPTGLTASAGDASVTLSWSNPSDDSITGYEYNVNHNATGTGNFSGWSPWRAIGGSGADTTSHTLTGLTNGREYRFHLRAVNADGAGAAAPDAHPWFVSATPQEAAPPPPPEPADPPGKVSSVTVTRGNGTLHASWPAVPGATSYHVTYSSDNGASWSLAALHHAGTSITISGVDNALTYLVGVRARNEHGDSGWRNSPSTGPDTGKDAARIAIPDEPRGGAPTKTNLAPAFDTGAAIADLSYAQGARIAPLTLPAATGGDGALSYALQPALPQGMRFDKTTRVLSGTPAEQMKVARYTYTVTDADGDTAQLYFRLAATPSARARAEESVLTDGLASQGRAVLGSARRALDGRFRDADQAVDLSVLRANWSSWQDRLTAAAKGPSGTTSTATAGGSAGTWGRTSSMPPHDASGRASPEASGETGIDAAAATSGWGQTSSLSPETPGSAGDASLTPVPGVFGLSGLSGTCGTMALEETPWPDASDSRVDNGWDDGACNGAASVRLSDWLWGRRYALRLNGMFGNGDDDEARSGPDWTLWSAGDQHRVEGAPGQNRYETDWRSMHLGLDARFNSDWLAGVVVSRGWGETGYGYEAQGISGAGGTGYGYESSGLSGTGELSTDIWTALPYLHGRLGGFEVWGLAGGGWGEIRATRSEGDGIKEDSNLNLWLGAVGASKPLLGLGAMSLSFVADAGMTYLTTEKGEGTLDGLEATTQQVRLGLAGEYEASLFDGQAELTPFWQLSGRYDGGDGLAGAGLEAQAGLRYRSERLSLVAQGHWLGMHSETGYKEYGASMEARVSPLAHGRGLTLALSPRWGADGALSGAASGMGTANSAAGIGAMWDTDIVRRAAIANTQAVNDDTAHVWSVDAEVGYGLWLPYQLGLLTPFSEMRLAGGHEQRQRLGLRLDAAGAQGLQLELTGFRASTYLETDTGVNLNATLSY